MATKKTVGALIKEARTAAGLSQAKLAEKVDGVSSSDIGKAERDEKELTQAALKQIAKATGVTQKSLLEAPSGVKKTSAAKTTSSKTSSKTSTSKKTSSSSKTSSSKKTSSSSKKSDEELKLTATEKKLVELYRAADSATKKKATAILKGENPGVEDVIEIVGTALTSMMGGKEMPAEEGSREMEIVD